MLKEIAERLLQLLLGLVPEKSVPAFQVSPLFLRNRKAPSFLYHHPRHREMVQEGKV